MILLFALGFGGVPMPIAGRVPTAHTGFYLMELSRLNQNSELWKLGVEYAKRAARLNPDSRESRQIQEMKIAD